jgi:hypothetical protein
MRCSRTSPTRGTRSSNRSPVWVSWRARSDASVASLTSSQHSPQGSRITRSAIANAVDEEAWRPVDPAPCTALDVSFDASRDGRIEKVRFESRHVEAKALGVVAEAAVLEVALVSKELVMTRAVLVPLAWSAFPGDELVMSNAA